MDKSIWFPKPELCRWRNSHLPLSSQSPGGLKLVPGPKYLKHLCTNPHLKTFAKVPFLFSFLLSVSWQIWWITPSSSEMWPFVAISIMARWKSFCLLGTGFLFVPAHFFSPQSHRLGIETIGLDFLNLGASMFIAKPPWEILTCPEQQMEPGTKPLAGLSLGSASGQRRGNWALLWFYMFSFPWRCLSKKDFIFHLKIILWLQC